MIQSLVQMADGSPCHSTSCAAASREEALALADSSVICPVTLTAALLKSTGGKRAVISVAGVIPGSALNLIHGRPSRTTSCRPAR